MNKHFLGHLIVSLSPLWALIALVVLFIYPVHRYVQCKGGGCVGLDENLKNVMVLDDPSRKTVTADTEEVKRKKELAEKQRTALIYSGRLNFLFLVMIYIPLSVFVIFVGCYLCYRCLKMLTPDKAWKWIILIGGATLTLALFLYFNPELHMRILRPLIQSTVASDLSSAENLIRLSNSCAFAAAFLLTIASVLTLLPRHAASYPQSLEQISNQMKYLRTVLYLGTFSLVSGVLMVRALYQWSVAFVSREELAVKAAEGFLSVLLAAEGGFFTLVLAGVYIPAAMILHHRATTLPDLPVTEEEKEKTLKNYNLSFSFMQSLPRVAAILGPLLAGPVGELFSRLG